MSHKVLSGQCYFTKKLKQKCEIIGKLLFIKIEPIPIEIKLIPIKVVLKVYI